MWQRFATGEGEYKKISEKLGSYKSSAGAKGAEDSALNKGETFGGEG